MYIGAIIFWAIITFGIYKSTEKYTGQAKRKYKKINVDNEKQEYEEVIRIYENLYNDNREELEKNRKNFLIITSILTPIIIICICMTAKELLIDGMGFDEASDALYIVGLILILGVIGTIIHNSYYKYNNLVKKQVISKFIEYVNPNLKYHGDILTFMRDNLYTNDRHKEIVKEYEKANFEDAPIELAKIEDFVSGRLKNDTNIQTMDINLFKTEITSGRSRVAYLSCFFNGNLTILDKSIDNHIKILNYKSVDLQDIDINDGYVFDKYFNVISKDNYEAERYLTLELKSFLVEFLLKYKIRFDIVLKDKIYIKFYSDNMFEAKGIKKSADIDSIKQWYVINEFVEEFVEKLDV